MARISIGYRLLSVTLFFLALLAFGANAHAETYYISPGGSDVHGDGSYNLPWQTLETAFSKINSGDELILQDGEYTGPLNIIDNSVPDGSGQTLTTHGANGQPTIIRAEHPHKVTINAGELNVNLDGKKNILIDGIRFIMHGGRLRQCENITIRRSGFHLQTASTYGITFGITEWRESDGGDNGPSQYCLIEECWFWGEGRYAAYAHLSNNIIWRRCVFRTDSGNVIHDDPNYCLAIYASDDCIVENCIMLDNEDAREDGGTDVGGLFNTIGSSGNPPERNRFYGNIILNITGNPFSQDAKSYASDDGPNYAVNNIIWDGDNNQAKDGWGVYNNGDIRNYHYTNNTIGNIRKDSATEKVGGASGSGGASWAHNLIINNHGMGLNNGLTEASSSYGNNAFNNCLGSQVINCKNYNEDYENPGISADPKLKYLPDPSITTDGSEPPKDSDGKLIGATVLKRYHNGTLTSQKLWPFPNEEWIKNDFSDPPLSRGSTDPTRGFCAQGQTLTKYIWEYLGNTIPKEIYGDQTEDPAAPRGLKIVN